LFRGEIMGTLAAIILAAGQGTRMKSQTPKVLHDLAGRPLLQYAVDLARALYAKPIVVVVGHGAEAVQAAMYGDDLMFAQQKPQLGTGHAVKFAREALQDHSEEVLILSGDVPLLGEKTVLGMVEQHRAQRVGLTALVGHLEDPAGYGRILRDDEGRVMRVVEQRDASEEELQIREVNAGTYCAENDALFKALDQLQRDNAQGEYYLTDVVALLAHQGVGTFPASSPEELLGVNDRSELAAVERIIQRRLRDFWMKEGVTLLCPESIYLNVDVKIGQDTIIEPGVSLKGQTEIGKECKIGTGSVIENSMLEDAVVVRPYSIILQSRVSSEANIGPFAHLRIGSDIGPNARIGNFVEVKKTKVGRGSKASHLTYLGDSEIGKGVNIGAGTITCNYDGVTKHRTVLEDDVFIGSNTELVAPVRVGKGAMVGAGSTITKNVPPGALAIGRARQTNLAGRARRRVQRKGK
jgi:bifunctional UDP-N-acetylglucosamine pyrophosphorylase/glucosamine-1-phosphate N-acetyltransferase